MRCFSGLAIAILSVFLCAAVSAATVKLVRGNVLINRGNGFQHVRGTSEVKVGDTIMARADGSARVIYDDTCWVPVKPGHVVVIAPEPPCHKMASFDPYGMLPRGAVGGIAVAAGLCIAEEGICDNKDRAASP